jgi:hypothetical protein
MAKRKRSHKRIKQQPRESEALFSRATLFRVELLDLQMRALLQQSLERLNRLLEPEEHTVLSEIEAAATPEALIDLAGSANGFLKIAWSRQAERFGLEILPLVAMQLRGSRGASAEIRQQIGANTLIAELRWRGQAGVELLLELFDDLDEEDQELACVVIGLVGLPEAKRQEGIDRIRGYLEQVENEPQNTWPVGARWALIDLKDPQVADLLYLDLAEGGNYPEIWGFLSLAGNARAATLLLALTAELPEDQRDDPMLTLVSIAHRIGRADFIQTLVGDEQDREVLAEIEEMVDALLSIEASTAKEYFSLFYRGFSADEVESIYGRLGI